VQLTGSDELGPFGKELGLNQYIETSRHVTPYGVLCAEFEITDEWTHTGYRLLDRRLVKDWYEPNEEQ
jgi:hypothetical protein